jgi:iron complex outermembrane receptor protein
MSARSPFGVGCAPVALASTLAPWCSFAQSSLDEPPPRPKETVVVTGSRLELPTGQSAQEVRIYPRERIERSGRSTVADFLSTLPEVSLNSIESTFVATSVRLRGAREGSTLILLNGRRTQPVSGDAAPFGFFDLNTIPLSMVDRIEILPNGSSAVYGGEALAGVVNIVLRKDFTGAEATLAYKGARNTDEKSVSGGAGWKGDRTAISLMASYSERTSLLGRDRDITSDPDLRRFGGPNLGTALLGAPGNISSVSGNLPGLGASFAAVPAGSPGVGLTPSSFAATAGTQNTGSFTRYQSSIPDSRRAGLFLDANYRLAPALDVFTEILATKYKLYAASSPPSLQLVSVPATNAFNPFGTAVRASGVVMGAEDLSRFTFSDEFVRPLVGVRGTAGRWDWEATAMLSRDRGSMVTYGRPVAARLTAALASPVPGAALDPFVDGPWGSRELLASIYSATVVTEYSARDTLLNAFARGPLLQLPAGPLDAVAGAEFEDSTLARGFGSDRNVHAAFAELRAPILPGEHRREVLAVQAAVRYDRYSDFGTKATWQAGMEFRPIEPMLLRATYGTAFKPPTLYNLGAPPSGGPIPVTDPLNNRQQVVAALVQGGNASLQPTTGNSGTLGVVWSPRQVRGLDVSLTAWRLRIDNAINLPAAQFIVDNESFYTSRVTRGPASAGGVGPIVAIDGTYLNFGVMREEGIDGSIDYRFATRWGEIIPAAAATYMTKFTGASSPGGPDVDRLSRANADGIFAPRVKANVSLGWNPASAFRLGASGRYIGRYLDYTPTRTIGDIWYFDGFADVSLEPALGMGKGSLAGARLILSATNLANKMPTWSTHFRGYDVYNYDLVGRTLLVQLQFRH